MDKRLLKQWILDIPTIKLMIDNYAVDIYKKNKIRALAVYKNSEKIRKRNPELLATKRLLGTKRSTLYRQFKGDSRSTSKIHLQFKMHKKYY